MDAANIVGAYMGITEIGTAEGGPATALNVPGTCAAKTWAMPGCMRSPKLLPAGKWGYRYWDALEYLKNQGVTAYRYRFPADYY